ncbi:cell surface protein [Vitiosangium sp. GDMCC 1.1324]|uniref:cell surface protein n=1 Tax=Vitiosangium sp. (strain GDMCC 1.1324) TaxID=2138576 RepID=UPI000D341416|nr:cell surface protein [Vitiosangium sp. GDMCC 1.1324]PTL81353.1 cell surface protein [Vitiosangium sp. GDMCC 1.1324]
MKTHATLALWRACLVLSLLAAGCGGPSDPEDDSQQPVVCPSDSNPFADKVVSFTPGAFAGFGQDGYPDIVLGPPHGGGSGMGSLDVLSLGKRGEIVLELTDLGVVDGPGVDLLVFENPFSNFSETGFVAVSEDGQTWHEFPCAPTDYAGGNPGCAGVKPVFSSPDNGISPTDPSVAGGDGFDLATLGVARARFIRIRDSGENSYGSTSGGFDLDAIAVVNGSPICEWK